MAGQQPNRKYRPQTGDGETIYPITNCESGLLLEGRLPGCQPGCLLTADCPPAVISNCALSLTARSELTENSSPAYRPPAYLHTKSAALASPLILGPLSKESAAADSSTSEGCAIHAGCLQRRISHPGFSTPEGPSNAEPPAKAHQPVGLHPAAVRCPTTQRVHAKRPQRNPRCNTLQRRTNDQAGPCQGPGEKNTNETLFFCFCEVTT